MRYLKKLHTMQNMKGFWLSLFPNGIIDPNTGIQYDSLEALLDANNVSYSAFYARTYKHKKSVSDALVQKTVKKSSNVVCPLDGKVYNSVSAMCTAHGFSSVVIHKMLKRGYSLERAFRSAAPINGTKEVIDHLGNIFFDITSMCKHYGISTSMYYSRQSEGWSLEETLTIPSKRINYNTPSGQRVGSAIEMANTLGMSYCQYQNVVKSVEKKIDIDVSKKADKAAEALERLGYYYIKNTRLDTVIDSDLKDYFYQIKIGKVKVGYVVVHDKNIVGCIDCDDESHFYKKSNRYLERTALRDAYKTAYCEAAQMPYLRVRFDQMGSVYRIIKRFVNKPVEYVEKHNPYLTEEEYYSIRDDISSKVENIESKKEEFFSKFSQNIKSILTSSFSGDVFADAEAMMNTSVYA